MVKEKKGGEAKLSISGFSQPEPFIKSYMST